MPDISVTKIKVKELSGKVLYFCTILKYLETAKIIKIAEVKLYGFYKIKFI